MNYLKDAPKNIWDYEQEGYHKLTDKDVAFSEMTESERRLVHGLIRYVRPKRILEIGVAEGGGSIVLLNAIEDMPQSTLTSIDLLNTCWNDSTKEVGFAAKEKHSDNIQWDLRTGSDPSQLIEELGAEGKFDVCIIDTAHIHPIESLNFLTVFPFLTENCVVILHDIGLYVKGVLNDTEKKSLFATFPLCFFATKLLFDTMVGEKRVLPTSEYSHNATFTNIGVCQLQEESEKNIGNIFSMLDFPWGIFPENLDLISQIIKKHYSEELYEGFLASAEKNARLVASNNKGYFKVNTDPLDYSKKRMVFYGCGIYIKGLLSKQDWVFSHPVSEIWDQNASTIDAHFLNKAGCAVKTPDFEVADKEDVLVVITLNPDNKDVVKKVSQMLEQQGFTGVLHFEDLKRI